MQTNCIVKIPSGNELNTGIFKTPYNDNLPVTRELNMVYVIDLKKKRIFGTQNLR